MSRAGQYEYAQIITLLAEQVEQWVDKSPVLVARANHNAPRTVVDERGVGFSFYARRRRLAGRLDR